MFESMHLSNTSDLPTIKRTLPAFQCKSQQNLRCTFCTETRAPTTNNLIQKMEDRTCVRPVDSAPCDLNKILQGAMTKRSELLLRRCNKIASSPDHLASAGQK